VNHLYTGELWRRNLVRMAGFHPTEPVPTGIANGRCGSASCRRIGSCRKDGGILALPAVSVPYSTHTRRVEQRIRRLPQRVLERVRPAAVLPETGVESALAGRRTRLPERLDVDWDRTA